MEDRVCEPTEAIRNAAIAGHVDWWLRSPGSEQFYARYVNSNGAFLDWRVDRSFTAIRPVIWVSTAYLPS